MHGEALAAVYPEFVEFTAPYAMEKFARVARIFCPELSRERDEVAAMSFKEIIVAFLKEIGMWLSLSDLKIPREDIPEIAEFTFKLPDYTANPRVPQKEEVLRILESAYIR